MKTALIAGGTGLIGKHLLQLLLDSPHYGTVHSVGRRTTGRSHPKLHEYVVDFDKPDDEAPFSTVDDVFCCLGTTMKQAGSREAFRKVDRTYVLRLADAAARAGVHGFSMVSSMGADKGSLFYYNRVKGETEEAVIAVGIERTSIFRPSLLLGERNEKRAGEEIATVGMRMLQPLLRGPMKKYRPIEARAVAQAMHDDAQQPAGTRVIESDRIMEIANQREQT